MLTRPTEAGHQSNSKDVMKLQIKINPETQIIEDAKFKTFGCGSAIASSSLATEWVKGRTVDEALSIKNTEIVKELNLPPVKIHCSVLAEDAIKAAIRDYKHKQVTEEKTDEAAVNDADLRQRGLLLGVVVSREVKHLDAHRGERRDIHAELVVRSEVRWDADGKPTPPPGACRLIEHFADTTDKLRHDRAPLFTLRFSEPEKVRMAQKVEFQPVEIVVPAQFLDEPELEFAHLWDRPIL